MTATSPSRRAVLATAAGTAGAVALTACGSDDGSDSDSAGSAGSDGSETNDPGSDSGETETETETEDGGDDGGEALASVDDVPVGEATAVTIDGEEAMLFRPDESTVAAFSAICTHNGCTVAPEGAELHCPCHGSVFDAATGEVLDGPAPEALPSFTVRIEGDQIVSG